MRISNVMDYILDQTWLPTTLTENSEYKLIRVLGLFLQIMWFLPYSVLAILICGILAIPALIQDA